jgi:hypothetical protein
MKLLSNSNLDWRNITIALVDQDKGRLGMSIGAIA